MVSVKTTFKTPEEARARRAGVPRRVEEVRVVPADGDGFTADDMRALLVHPKAGGFRNEGDIGWPLDTFTFRRLREGSIKLSSEKSEEKPKTDL
jgi:hypothetical protein